jgi:hypothetical protein
MNSPCRYVAGTIASFTAAAMKPNGGRAPGLIRPARPARCGSKRIRCRQPQTARAVMPPNPQPFDRRIASIPKYDRRVGNHSTHRKKTSSQSTVSHGVA